MARMRVNGQALEFALDPATPLLWALRDAANLTGTKQGCGGTGQCGACTVIVDGGAVLSCKVTIGSLEGADVTTIESSKSDLKVLGACGEYRNELGPGLYDIHSPRVPSEQEIKDRIADMLAILPDNLLVINPVRIHSQFCIL